MPSLSEILPPFLRQMWSKCFVTSLPQTELYLSLFGCACLCYAVPVFVTLCLSVLGCACLCYAVPIFIGLCLSLSGCACLCYAVPVRIGLCLSLLHCAYLYWVVPVFVRLCLSVLGCACLCYAVPNRVQLCWPCVCLCCLETEYWPWFPFIDFTPSFVLNGLVQIDPRELT